MDSGEVAAVAGAVGAALILLGRGRVLLLVGLGLLAVAELGLVHDLSGNRVSTKIAALGALGLIPIAIGAWVFVRWPVLVTPLVAIAAPFRPPLSFGSEHRYFVGVASSGQLGRLLPLYGVLGATALALGWHALRGRVNRPVPFIVSIPAAVFVAVAGLSLLWTEDLVSGENVLAYFLLPFAVLVVVVPHAPSPPWLPKALAVIAVGLATLFAVVGIIQAATHKLWFFSPSVEVGNAYSSYFRVTSLFRDPSLYGRHVVLGVAVVLVAVLCRKLDALWALPLIVLLFAGLWFSYSQSSMAALFVVTAGLAAYTAFLGGAAVLIFRVYRIDEPLGLGLGAVLLAQFVHSLAYSGFFEDPVTWLAVGVAAGFMLSRADRGAILGP